MANLISEFEKYGSAKIEGKETIEGKNVPILYFGQTKMNDFFDVVDEVAKQDGGSATLFVKSGNDYIRIATNVKKDDGSRVVGTMLDPSGPAIEADQVGRTLLRRGDDPREGLRITAYEP